MKKIIIIAVAALALLGGAGGAVYFLAPGLLPEAMRPKSAADAEEATRAAAKAVPEIGADLDVFVVNLAGPGPSRYLRTTLSLGVKNERAKDKVKDLSGKIRHAVIMHLSQLQPEDLSSAEGKNKLRQELQQQINDAAGDNQFVSNVYFKEFLIQ